jgi:inhibitor of KinA sporulation pathway (predicted exonuclease)
MITLERMLCVDVESTCWNGFPPDKEFSEIIEIGVAVIDVKKLTILGGASILVKPKWSKVGGFCTELTSLTQEIVDGGLSLQDACARLKKEFGSRDYAWCSYGDYDRKMFLSDCAKKGASYPFSDSHINAKAVFNYLCPQRNTSVGLQAAAEALGLAWEGQAHRGGDDAMNLARIMIDLASKERTKWEF